MYVRMQGVLGAPAMVLSIYLHRLVIRSGRVEVQARVFRFSGFGEVRFHLH